MHGMPLLAAIATLLLQTAPAPTPTPATLMAAQTAPAVAPDAPAAPPLSVAELIGPPAPSSEPELIHQVWIFIDRWKEFGGTVVSETDLNITVTDGFETRTFNKAKVLDIIELVHPQPGQRGLVQLRDGTIVRGEILKDSLEEVEFKVDSVRGRVPREKVYRVMLELEFETRYARIKAAIAPEEHGRRLGLARWLTDQGRLDLATAELEALLRDGDVDDAREMLREINARVKLEKSVKESRENGLKKDPVKNPDGTSSTSVSANGSGGATSKPAPHGAPTSREMLPKDLLSNEDVNIVRVYEIDFKDPPRMTVSPEGVRQLILRYGSSALVPATTAERNALYSKSSVEIARLLFDLKARDLYSYIEVEEDPTSVAKFRTRVHNSWLISNCATSRCHGGVDAGRFFLYTGNAKDQRIRYTNLLTLLSFKVDGKPLVNFEDPPSSLLIQYAMTRSSARYPHPDVKGWKPILSSSTPQLLQDTLDWIRTMYQPRPEYPVKYIAPKLDAPDKPASGTDTPDR
ncbi:MAG: hypothetical protein DWH86_04300 [Planctomycetota bacterium]|nr:MAG: hypothetical protein DWH86_04300 [Planctomycetota bacterium]